MQKGIHPLQFCKTSCKAIVQNIVLVGDSTRQQDNTTHSIICLEKKQTKSISINWTISTNPDNLCMKKIYVLGTISNSTSPKNTIEHGLIGLSKSKLIQQEIVESKKEINSVYTSKNSSTPPLRKTKGIDKYQQQISSKTLVDGQLSWNLVDEYLVEKSSRLSSLVELLILW